MTMDREGCQPKGERPERTDKGKEKRTVKQQVSVTHFEPLICFQLCWLSLLLISSFGAKLSLANFNRNKM